jgi:nucleoid-associated protein YgaU
MAVRKQDFYPLGESEGLVYDFPLRRAHARARRARAAQIRRRRLLALSVVVVTIALVWAAARPRPYAAGSRPGAPRAVVVDGGQTLWGLSQRYAPLGVDWRDYSDALVEINHLEGAIQAGERLRLPR